MITDFLIVNFLTAVLTVRVIDVNDNAPEFILNTLDTLRSVVEEAAAGTLIGKLSNESLQLAYCLFYR